MFRPGPRGQAAARRGAVAGARTARWPRRIGARGRRHVARGARGRPPGAPRPDGVGFWGPMPVLRAASAGAVATRCTKSRRQGRFRAIRCASCATAAAARLRARWEIGHCWTKRPALFRIAESRCVGGASGRRRGGCRRTYVRLVAPTRLHGRRRLPRARPRRPRRVGHRRACGAVGAGPARLPPPPLLSEDRPSPGRPARPPSGPVPLASGARPAGTGCDGRRLHHSPPLLLLSGEVHPSPGSSQGRTADPCRPPPITATGEHPTRSPQVRPSAVLVLQRQFAMSWPPKVGNRGWSLLILKPGCRSSPRPSGRWITREPRVGEQPPRLRGFRRLGKVTAAAEPRVAMQWPPSQW
ncbi:hypothetical protein EKD16_14980 [Streptomonospora litoralis]|uniref:Uncharacterized protein n=1 Tax=Streptomonospora litoralis TaxID=2498135 RepID=A0A4P6Q764_9ACTN|nr:hypothetical protein EKD16_14980 [Streptomonospora litoralis]